MSFSVFANGEFYEHALNNVMNQGVIKYYGLHLNLTEGKALNKNSINMLSDENNRFKISAKKYFLLNFLKLNKTFKSIVYDELKSQIKWVLKDGIQLSHFDSHEHIHHSPWIFKIITDLGKEFKIKKIRFVNEKIIITDIYDMYSSHTGNEKEQDLQLSIKKKEKTIINNSDIIFTVSEQIKNCIKFTNKTIHIIHHGVDYNSFQIKKNNEHSIKRNVETINRPILGYIGSMFSKIDFALLNYTAVCKPNWSILLIGSWWLKNEKDIELFDELINKDNVHYLGEKPKEQLPGYLSQMDVCLMPFKKIEFVKYMAPLKLLEYLAAGKPIVAIDREVKYDFSEFIKVASTKKDFVAAIGEALEEERQNDKSLVEARKNIARENSWETRVDQMMGIIETHLNNRD